jgi:hypothetical protein
MTATPLLGCPTPYKHAYATRGQALAGFIVGPETRAHHPYRCRCGHWHITSGISSENARERHQ